MATEDQYLDIEPTEPMPATIGVCWIDESGTIFLRLRSERADGSVGDAQLSYPAAHRQYQMILDHVGPLTVGETKFVKPFP